MSKIIEPFQIKNYVLKNRIMMAPMCMYQAQDGFANDFHYVHYATRAQGGAALIVLEATAVLPDGRISVNDLGIWSDQHIEGLSKIARLIKENGAHAGIQISHAGRKARVETSYAPSKLAFEGLKEPKELTLAEIEDTILAFKEAAVRADKAGFDFLEIHGAHGYLINQFISPLTNKRTDKYKQGTTFLKEIIKAIKSVWPKEKVIQLRVSTNEYDPKGLTVKDYAELLKDIDVDMINVSTGGVVLRKVDTYPLYQIDDAKYIKVHLNKPVIGGGLLTNITDIEKALESVDLVYLGRLLLRDPFFIARKFEDFLIKPYERAKQKR